MSIWNSTYCIQFYDVDTHKFWRVQYDILVNCQNSECLMMLIKIINKGTVPYCGSNNNSIGGSLSDILF